MKCLEKSYFPMSWINGALSQSTFTSGVVSDNIVLMEHHVRFVWHNTVNSPIRAQYAQTQHWCALIWKVVVESFPTVYDNPYFLLYMHVIYRWKALDLNDERRGCALIGSAPLLGNLRYSILYYFWAIVKCLEKKLFSNLFNCQDLTRFFV